jgi:dihydropyrimidinase
MRYHLGDEVIEKMTKRVAFTQGLHSKGQIKEGLDADITIFKKDMSTRVHGNHGTCDYSVYENLPTTGKVISTLVRGQFVLKDGVLIKHKGQLIKGSDFL